MSLSKQIFTGLLLGVFAGLFFGEGMAFLEPVGQAFIKLLKMAVLPYIVVTLMAALGRLHYAEAGRLLARVGGILLLIWVLTFAVLAVVPLTFPELEHAAFFSTTLLERPAPFDFLEFIPDNPFGAMAKNVVPAVVLFSVAVGLALMGIENKQDLIRALDVLGAALSRVMGFVTRLTPYGLFAIAASSAGTLRLDELGRLQVYVVVYIGATLLMTFGMLPLLATMLGPLHYRHIMARTKDALVTAFATDSLLVVLPQLASQARELVAQAGASDEESASAVEVIVPASFTFPNPGRLLQLAFVLFGAWFAEASLSLAQRLELLFAGWAGFFGKPVAAMPFLLDLARVPADLFQLYLVSGVVVARFGTLVAAMHTFVLAVVGGLAMQGRLHVRWPRVLMGTAVSLAALAAFGVGSRVYFEYALEGGYDKDQIIEQMQLLDVDRPAVVHRTPPEPLAEDLTRPALERVRERGFLRVGVVHGNLPFVFFNGKGDLVGFDVAMAHDLAEVLDVGLEFFPVTRAGVVEALVDGTCDIVMSAIVATATRAERLALSQPYLDQTVAFVVRDHLREQYSSLDTLRSLPAQRLAVFADVPLIAAVARKTVPNATQVPIATPVEFFEDEQGRFDALLFTAEMGSAFSLLHPEFSVAIPQPLVMRLPIVYPMPPRETAMRDFVSAWIELKRKDGTIDRLYDYWILGQDAVAPTPRWSVIRDVLGWID